MSISTPQAMAEYVISNGTQWDARRADLWLRHGQTAALRSLFVRIYHTDTTGSAA